MLLKIGASNLSDLLHANHPPKPFPAHRAKGKDADTTRQKGSELDAKIPPQGVIIVRNFAREPINCRWLRRRNCMVAEGWNRSDRRGPRLVVGNVPAFERPRKLPAEAEDSPTISAVNGVEVKSGRRHVGRRATRKTKSVEGAVPRSVAYQEQICFLATAWTLQRAFCGLIP